MEYHVTRSASSKSIVEARLRLQTDEHRTSRLYRTDASASQTHLLGDKFVTSLRLIRSCRVTKT